MRRADHATPLYPQKLAVKFRRQVAVVSRYSSLADWGPRSFSWCLCRVSTRHSCPLSDHHTWQRWRSRRWALETLGFMSELMRYVLPLLCPWKFSSLRSGSIRCEWVFTVHVCFRIASSGDLGCPHVCSCTVPTTRLHDSARHQARYCGKKKFLLAKWQGS
jgi:hypothetical protein